MRWIRLRKSSGLALAFLGISLAAAASADDEVSLKVESKVPTPGTQPGTIEVLYTLVNTSSKPITAYKFGCTDASQNGFGNFSYLGEDGYLPFERFQAGQDVQSSRSKGYLMPGDRVTQTMDFDLLDLDGPFSGATCGTLVVVFADTSIEGEPSLAETFFIQRANSATDAQNAYRSLVGHLGHGKPLNDAIGKIASEQGRSALHENGANGTVELMSQLRGTAEDDQEEVATWLLAQLQADYESAMRHLPDEWKKAVLRRIEP